MLLNRSCPVCNAPHEEATLFLKETIDQAALNSFSYASRKEPEYMSHRLMCCGNCGLIFACSPPEQSELAHEYHKAEYDTAVEANDAAESYRKAILTILAKLKTKKSALEIGAGTGIFLELLQAEGFTELVGVEPSSAAILAAPVHRRKWLKMEIFEKCTFKPASFDLICCFMTLEHVRDPLEIALSAFHLLKPGGVFVTVTHDYESMVNRLLGKKSPIIDIEHMQLFSDKSISELFIRSGFRDISNSPFTNRYELNYWVRLAPLPKLIKRSLKWIITIIGISRFKCGINVGNTITAGFRPINE
jgi:SAM-dependent methyltransferase